MLEGLNIPTYPYEILKDNGGILVRRNTALVNEVLAQKERKNRMVLNTQDTVLSMAA